MGIELPPFYGKSKFYQHKKSKALSKIAKLQEKIAKQHAIVKECDKNLASNEK